jgi:hypothetical protein
MPLDVRECFCLHSRRTGRLLTQFYDDALRPSGLRITQFLPLADILGMDRTTLTRNLALLERDGPAAIAKGMNDKRESQIRLTPAGRRASQRAMPHWQHAQQQLLNRLSSVPNPTTGPQAQALLDRIGFLTADQGEVSA